MPLSAQAAKKPAAAAGTSFFSQAGTQVFADLCEASATQRCIQALWLLPDSSSGK